MGFWTDFKKFISKGNIIDLSVGVVIGSAFGKITSSLVNDIIMPLVGMLIGGLDVSDWKIVLKEAVLAEDGSIVTAENALRYGAFIQAVLDFLIIAFSIFVVLRVIMKMKEKVRSSEEKAAEEARQKAEAEAKAAAEQAEAAAAAAKKKVEDERAEELALLRGILDKISNLSGK